MSVPLLLAVIAALAAAAFILGLLWHRTRARAGELERAIGRLEGELERERDARESFFDFVTHELRSPLSAILGYQELLGDGAYGALDEGAAEPVDRIGRSARHLLHLIDGVVDLSRLRAGAVQPELEAVQLGVVMATAADAFRTSARERGLEPDVSMPQELPTIRSDQDRLSRALDLLITSAVKHPAGDDISLEISAADHGATARIRGTAIAPHSTDQDPTMRLGLRLAVALGITEILGGSLDIDTDQDGVVRGFSFAIRDLDEPAAPPL